jgi:hypothetical protein
MPTVRQVALELGQRVGDHVGAGVDLSTEI